MGGRFVTIVSIIWILFVILSFLVFSLNLVNVTVFILESAILHFYIAWISSFLFRFAVCCGLIFGICLFKVSKGVILWWHTQSWPIFAIFADFVGICWNVFDNLCWIIWRILMLVCLYMVRIFLLSSALGCISKKATGAFRLWKPRKARKTRIYTLSSTFGTFFVRQEVFLLLKHGAVEYLSQILNWFSKVRCRVLAFLHARHLLVVLNKTFLKLFHISGNLTCKSLLRLWRRLSTIIA